MIPGCNADVGCIVRTWDWLDLNYLCVQVGVSLGPTWSDINRQDRSYHFGSARLFSTQHGHALPTQCVRR